MSLSQSEERMLQQLRDDVDRLIANGRAPSRESAARDDGATRVQVVQTGHGFLRGRGVYLDVDGVWKTINGVTFGYDGFLWGVVSNVTGVNRSTVIVKGKVTLPGSSFIKGTAYGFDANGDPDDTANVTPLFASDSSTLIIQGVASSGAIYEDVVDPTVNDDETDGFIIGTIWINTISDSVFISADVTTGSAVWVSASGTGGACTVLGRSANSSGARADIVAATNGTVLTRIGDAIQFLRDIILGTTANAGSLTIANATSATAIVLSPTLVNAAGKVIAVREIDVCDAGTAKKMLVVGSAPY